MSFSDLFINDIASQTNLFALNATIEMEQAGDAGKRFAIIASEVVNFAHQTARATENISGRIMVVQQATTDSVEAIGGLPNRSMRSPVRLPLWLMSFRSKSCL